MNIPGLTQSDKVDRIDSGSGEIRERTIELGDVVIIIENIGSMSVVDGKRDQGPIVMGGMLAVLGLLLVSFSAAAGALLIVVGLGLALRAHFQAVDVFLSIGTCDGRQLHLVSKKRSFLLELRSVIRQKIDLSSAATATFNMSGGTINGGLALGVNARATGQAGSIYEGA